MCHYHVKAVHWKLVFFSEQWDRYLFNLIMAASEMSKVSLDLFETAGTRGKTGEPPPCPFSTSAPWSPWHMSGGQTYLPIPIRNTFLYRTSPSSFLSGCKSPPQHKRAILLQAAGGSSSPVAWGTQHRRPLCIRACHLHGEGTQLSPSHTIAASLPILLELLSFASDPCYVNQLPGLIVKALWF